MSYSIFLSVVLILFWIAVALVACTFAVWVYVYYQYYKWDRQDRNRWGEDKDSENNLGGGI